jgi:hypothetical protein
MAPLSERRREDPGFAELPNRRRFGLPMMTWKSCALLRGID